MPWMAFWNLETTDRSTWWMINRLIKKLTPTREGKWDMHFLINCLQLFYQVTRLQLPDICAANIIILSANWQPPKLTFLELSNELKMQFKMVKLAEPRDWCEIKGPLENQGRNLSQTIRMWSKFWRGSVKWIMPASSALCMNVKLFVSKQVHQVCENWLWSWASNGRSHGTQTFLRQRKNISAYCSVKNCWDFLEKICCGPSLRGFSQMKNGSILSDHHLDVGCGVHLKPIVKWKIK